ncbi:MAG: hypothetical protein ACK5LC_08395, partial [Coprobacillaceae bacterium]
TALEISETSILNNIIKGNNTLEAYGGVCLWGNTNASIKSSTISNNEVSSSTQDSGLGGGIMINNNSSLMLQGSTINKNVARYGGGISVEDNSIANLAEENSLIANQAIYDGRGIWISKDSKLNIFEKNVQLKDNTSGGLGGSIYTDAVDDYTKLIAADYQNIGIDKYTIFTGNRANGVYQPPEIVNSYSDINFASTSVIDHPINNYDINYRNDDNLVYSITYYNVDDTTGYKKNYTKNDTTYILPIPKKEGYIFVRWIDSTKKPTKELLSGSSGDKEYTAIWKKKSKTKNENDKEKIVETSDSKNIELWLSILIVSGSIIIFQRKMKQSK